VLSLAFSLLFPTFSYPYHFFRYFAFSLHFRVFFLFTISILRVFFVAIFSPFFARHFPFFVASQFFRFSFYTLPHRLPFVSFQFFVWNGGILACCTHITAAADVWMS